MPLPFEGNVVVYGPSCAGKSTLGASIATRYGLRTIELDALAWDPGWQRASNDVFRHRVRDAIAEDGWIADGNYRVIRDVLWPRASTVIWLDFSLRVIIPRIVRRSWNRWRSNELLWGTNREAFWEHFLPNDRSLIWFSVRTHRSRRREFETVIAQPEWASLTVIRLRSPRELDRWLSTLPAPSPIAAPQAG